MLQSPKLEESDFRYFQELILEVCGINLTAIKKDLLQTRLMPRLAALNLNSFTEYREYLERLPKKDLEWQLLTNQISTNKTDFFRESAHFDFLLNKFLPAWQQKNQGRKLRAWSAATSSGEEAYTLAMVLDKFFRKADRFEIIATDIDTRVLRYAENAVYSKLKLSNIPVEYQKSCLAFGTGDLSNWFRVSRRISDKVSLSRRNLIDGPYHDLGQFDIIFCRNVFIYFRPELIQKTVRHFHEVTADEGVLFIGHSENLMQSIHAWSPVQSSIFVKHKAISALNRNLIESEQFSSPVPQVETTLTKKKVLVVDDSVTIRRLLTSIIEQSSSLEVVAAIGNPLEVEEAIASLKPDVMTLDINMPGMDGCQVLEAVLPKYQIPTVMISTLGLDQGAQVFKALELGAVDYIQKPSLSELAGLGPLIMETILTAASVKLDRSQISKSLSRKQVLRNSTLSDCQVIAIGSSTGGTQAIQDLLTRLPADLPPIVIVQHIPPVFSRALAERLDRSCALTIKEAEHGDILENGKVYIAPGSHHMKLTKFHQSYKIQLSDDDPVNRHRPSVDVLFNSVATVVGSQAIGVILTGMGNDGAEGLLKMRQAGARTIAQDEQSSVVFGMPKEAIRLDAAQQVVSLDSIPECLMNWLDSRDKNTRAV